MSFWRMSLCVVLGIGTLCYSVPAHALSLTIKRIVFEGPVRTETVTLFNDSDSEQTYRLGWQRMVMTAEGLRTLQAGEALPESIKPAEEMVLFSPRRVTLMPGQSQQVRLMLRTPAGLADGEYRSHFWIMPEAPVDAFVADEESAGEETGKTAVSVHMMTGVTVPVIVRKGKLDAQVSLSDLAAVGTGEAIDVRAVLHRSGNQSVYGNLKFYCEDGGSEALLREIKGLAVYTELTERPISYALENTDCAALRLDYRKLSDIAGQEGPLYASAKVAVAR